jgi:hypothetical protein
MLGLASNLVRLFLTSRTSIRLHNLGFQHIAVLEDEQFG